MSVYYRNNKWYVGYRPQGKYGPYVRLGLPPGTTEADARRMNSLILQEQSKRRSPVVTAVTGSTIAELWPGYEDYISIHRKPRTLDDVADSGNNICRILGKQSVEQLTIAHLDIYKRQRKQDKGRAKGTKVSPRTINKELSWLSGFLKWCRKNNFPAPKLEIEYLPYAKPIPIILTVGECMAILRNLDPLYRAFVACLYLTGMRIDEVRHLQWKDVDLAGRIVYVQKTKSKLPRSLGIPEWLAELFEDLKTDSPYLFRSRVTGGPIQNIRYALRGAAKKAGITKHVHPHLLRHSISSHLNALNVSTSNIMSFLGHSQIATTERYIHRLAQGSQDTARIIDKMLESENKR